MRKALQNTRHTNGGTQSVIQYSYEIETVQLAVESIEGIKETFYGSSPNYVYVYDTKVKYILLTGH